MTTCKPYVYMYLGLMLAIYACTISKPRNPANPTVKLSERLELIKLSELKGKPIQLIDYLGKPVFLNFWASWCGPCKNELETIELVSGQFKNDIVFLIASDEDPDKISKYISDNHFNLHFVHLDIPYIDAYIVKLPTTLLIDRSGNLQKEEEGFRIWTQPTSVEMLKKL